MLYYCEHENKFKELLARNYEILDLSHMLNREGNGTPLQYSCLENPMDGGAW